MRKGNKEGIYNRTHINEITILVNSKFDAILQRILSILLCVKRPCFINFNKTFAGKNVSFPHDRMFLSVFCFGRM